MKLKLTRFLSLIVVLAIMIPMMALTALADKTVVPIADCVTVTDTRDTGTFDSSSGVVTITNAGRKGQKCTITIKNISASKAVVKFDYAATGDVKSFSESSYTGSVETVLEPNGTYTMTVGIGYSLSTLTATVKLSNFSYTAIVEGPATITYNSYGSSVTVGGAEVGNGATSATVPEAGAQFVAIPASGATFVAWINKDTNEILSQEATANIKPYASSMNIEAVFTKSTETPYYKVGTTLYTDLSAAITAASAATVKTVVVISDGTLPTGEYNIPSGVTFLVPYSSSDFTIHSTTKTDSSGGMKSTLKYANTKLVCAGMDGEDAVRPKLLLPDVDVTYILTIPSATTLNVEKGGKFVVGGTIASGNRSTAGISCATAGAHSNVQLEGTLNLNGDMSVCGYILGDGQVNVNSGATVYQPYTAMDFIAGPVVIRCKEDSTFPFYRYAMTNIQSNMRIHSGGNVRGYVSLFTAEIKVFGIGFENQYNVTEFDLISDTGLVRLNSGSTLDLVYDADHYANDTDTNHRDLGMYHRVGKTTMTFIGGMTFGSTSLVVKVQGTDYPVDSTGDHFVIPYNYDIILNNGTYNVANPLKLLPGANMTVNSGATVQISNGGSLAIMSGLRDRRVYGAATSDENAWYNEHYPSTDVLRAEPFKGNGSANLILNGGTLQVDSGASFGGLVQTTGTGSVIMNGTNETQVRIGVLREKNEALGHQAGRGLYDLTAQLYAHNGNLITLESGKRYTAVDNAPNLVESYSYEYFASCDSDTTTSDTQPLNATVIGTWQCATEEQHSWSDATCTAPKTCSVCGATEGGPDAENHKGETEVRDAVTGNCGSAGYTGDTYCLGCGEKIATGEKIAATGKHTGGEATCKTQAICDTCDQPYGDLNAENHKGETEVRGAVTGNCGAAGYTGDTYCLDCDVKIEEGEEIPATGNHTGGEATCKDKAVCGTCGQSYGDLNAENHKGETEVRGAVTGNCGSAGYTGDTYCLDCDVKIEEGEEIPATGNHSGGEATCKDKAVCGTCGQSYGDLNAENHKGETEVRGAVTGNCGAAGYTGDTYCLDCGEKIATGEEIAATGEHTAGADDGNCTTAVTCTACGTVTTPANADHTWDAGEQTKAPTATEPGEMTYKCTVEGCNVTKTEEIPMVAECSHEGGTATCKEQAVCDKCGAAYGELAPNNHVHIKTVNAKDATCGADGYTGDTYCDDCKKTIETGTTIPATGEHSCVDFVCTVCGQHDGRAIRPFGTTISLDGVVYINHYVTLEGLDVLDEAYIQENGGLIFWSESINEDNAKITHPDVSINSGLVKVIRSGNVTYMGKTDGIPPKKYSDNRYLRIYVKLPDGNYVYGPLVEYSVQAYCEDKLSKNYDKSLKEVCASLLHFGAAAQEYFTWNTDDLANANILNDWPAYAYDASALQLPGAVTTNIASSEYVTIKGQTIALDGALVANFYYLVNSIQIDTAELLLWDAIEDELTLDNVTHTYDLELMSNGSYFASSYEIAAKNYARMVYACAKFTDVNGEVYYSEVIGYNPHAYANRHIGLNQNPKLVELLKRMIVYSEFANAYFY